MYSTHRAKIKGNESNVNVCTILHQKEARASEKRNHGSIWSRWAHNLRFISAQFVFATHFVVVVLLSLSRRLACVYVSVSITLGISLSPSIRLL